MSPQNSASTSYRIEISGWDVDENFFVEKTELDWNEQDGKKVRLRRPLRDGAVVFIRLMHPTAPGPTFPIAYQVERVRTPDAAGVWEAQIVQLHPRFAAHGSREPMPEPIFHEKRR